MTSRLILYLGAPFFAYPHKAFLNQQIGSEFSRAYAHFRRDHTTKTNLGLHFICLLFQITNNFALLSEMDDAANQVLPRDLQGLELISTSTLLSWIYTLWMHTDSSLTVKSLSFIFLMGAFNAKRVIRSRWNKEVMAVQSLIEMMAIQIFILKKENPSFALYFVMVLGRLYLQKLALEKLPEASQNVKRGINVALALFMLKACQDPFNAAKVPPFLFGLVGWIISLYTRQSWMCFYSGGFLATLGQGVAHFYAAEEPTMPQLALVGDEYAHATYFPNLVFQSMAQTLREGL